MINYQNTQFSSDSDSNTDDMSEPFNNKLIKKEKSQKNNKKSSNDISIATNEPSSSISNKPTIVEDVILKNPVFPNVVMNYLKHIVTDLQDMKNNQKIMRNDLHTLKIDFQQHIIKSIGENVPVHWTQENQIKWPLKTKEEYDKLNLLLTEEEIRKDFMARIAFVIDGGTVVSKNLLAVIRKFFHKDLATKFTCVKQTKDKFTLKSSALYDCIIEVFMMKSKKGAIPETLTEKLLDKLIGAILTNSKDWEKARKHKKIAAKVEDKENISDNNNSS
ncbi:uncharacterized protein LOC105833247 isoform X2 [Monomorium pharaonis]|uniref:uncharacterized protein LOC105833247 isoform X2 n=1 Tax=Monomorium pharaonis TaxID=307658 RepID=UPI00063FBB98|nr:uncharacterized protein LOC105833247 isoform X2 [Monomorium pharaonis]